MKLTDKFESSAGIYIFKCLINGKYYIGESLNIERRMNEHLRKKNQIIHRAIQKHGADNFEITVYYLPNFEEKDLLDLEEALIKRFDSLLPNGYNAMSRGRGSKGRIFTKETKLKMSISAKNKPPVSEETKKKRSEAQKGKKLSEETKLKISLKNKGSVRSEESKKRMVEGQKKRDRSLEPSQKGKRTYLRTEEYKQKMSLSLKGKIVTEETKAKLSEFAKNREKISCPHCNKTMDRANASRYHFSRCKALHQSP